VAGAVTTFGSLGAEPAKWSSGVVAGGGLIYGMPSSAASVLRISTAFGTAQTLGHLGGAPDKWRQGFVAANGAIYGIPSSTGAVLKVDVASGAVTTFSWRNAMPKADAEVQVMCLSFRCDEGTLPRPDAAAVVCRRWPCAGTCCLQSCAAFDCPAGYRGRRGRGALTCAAGSCSREDAPRCCVLDPGQANLVLPPLILLTAACLCVIRQLLRCRVERLEFDRRFRVAYLATLFAWDACDQTASWWFWQYASASGASLAVRMACLASATLGTAVLLLAFLAGLCLRTKHLLDFRLPELLYSVGAATADVLMLVAAFAFEMQGLDAGSWIKVLNLVATIFDFVLKVMQAAGVYCSAQLDDSPWDPLEELSD